MTIALKQNALPNFQLGFRAKHATFYQLYHIVDNIATSLEIKNYCSGLFLDVSLNLWHRRGYYSSLKKIFIIYF